VDAARLTSVAPLFVTPGFEPPRHPARATVAAADTVVP
jgi:hypothetical protein